MKTKNKWNTLGLIMIIFLLISIFTSIFTFIGLAEAASTNQFTLADYSSEMTRCEFMKGCNETALQDRIDTLEQEKQEAMDVWWPRLYYSSIFNLSCIATIHLAWLMVKRSGGKWLDFN